ncbi:hypothetical protein Q427_10845 [Halomonas sp. BC04]|nr:hypothetical protein Q427_10845 [Halomonas sp. BC04]
MARVFFLFNRLHYFLLIEEGAIIISREILIKYKYM